MRLNVKRMFAALGALALSAVFAPSAKAGCGTTAWSAYALNVDWVSSMTPTPYRPMMAFAAGPRPHRSGLARAAGN